MRYLSLIQVAVLMISISTLVSSAIAAQDNPVLDELDIQRCVAVSPDQTCFCEPMDKGPCVIRERTEISKDDFERLSRDVYQKLGEDAEKIATFRLDLAERGQRRVEIVVYAVSLIFVVLGALGVFMGLNRLGGLKSEIAAELKATAASAAAEEVPKHLLKLETEFADIRAKMNFSEFLALTQKISSGESFTREDRDQAITFAREFAVSIKSEKLGPSSWTPVRELAESLFQAGNWAQLRELERLFEDKFQEDKGLRGTMLQAYGNLVFSPAVQDGDAARARLYCQAAWNHNFGETALPFELVYDFKEETDPNRRREKIATRLDHGKTFDEMETAQFLNAFGAMLDPELLAKQPEPQHYAISRVAQEIMDIFWARFDDLSSKVNVDSLLARGLRLRGLPRLLEEIKKRKSSQPPADEKKDL